jgi:hypothetical protein
MAAPIIPCPAIAKTNRMPTPSGATIRSMGYTPFFTSTEHVPRRETAGPSKTLGQFR